MQISRLVSKINELLPSINSKTSNYAVEYRGVRTKEEKGIAQMLLPPLFNLKRRALLPLELQRQRMERTIKMRTQSHSEMTSFVAKTNSVTAVVVGKEKMKQAVAKDLSSAQTNPICEQAYTMAQNLDPRNEGIDVLQDCLMPAERPNPTLQFPPKAHSQYDRPTVKNGQLYFVSAHEKPKEWFKSWSAVYRAKLDSRETVRLTPTGFADISPAVSESGSLVAVASFGSRSWDGRFHDLDTEIAVFSPSTPSDRTVICDDGGWPTFSGDSTVYFHRKAGDGWWSVFRLDLTEDFDSPDRFDGEPKRITPPGVHAFTPSASHNGKWIAVATRRKETKYRHIEIFDLETERFIPVTELTNPNFHHYNPFFSPESGHLGYHRFRGESEVGDSIAPHLMPVTSPVKSLKMLRTPMAFPSFSPNGDHVALNGDFLSTPGLMILKSDGSKRWTAVKEPGAFYTVWSPTEDGVIYTAVGPIFESSKTTVQIARVSFNIDDLDDRDTVTSEVKLLTRSDAGNNAFPSVSPDGRFLVFRSGRSGHKNLYILDAVNGETEAGAEGSADVDRERINHVCFSPDSEWLLFTANFGAVSAESISFPNQFQPYGDLYICRLDGSELTRLTCNPYENGTPTWHSKGGVLDIGSMSLGAVAGDKLRGQFDEPLWLTCDV
ncbi:uncharacterized protein A4U43_C07F10850 [Asparagus officinalis]|uniref:Dipeptidylpeptidase IV N-terminal domain-containing protein n=1 Tax=Asparagus officinalis TaxID=4686 RepID=A0A5P1EAX5_ASPOF|nr:uncharacterized protein A4U43_C07F10850 [Asparagus officinalis]